MKKYPWDVIFDILMCVRAMLMMSLVFLKVENVMLDFINLLLEQLCHDRFNIRV